MNLKWLLFAVLLSGCQNASASRDGVLLLGDDARLSLSSTSGIDAPRKGASASEVANAALKAKHAVLVIDAANGPLPITREHILIARQAGVPSLSILVVNTVALAGLPDKAYLIEKEVAETRQIFDKYDIQGSSIPFFFDENGLRSILRETTALPARHSDEIPPPSRKDVSGVIYLLSVLESPGVEPIGHHDAITIWIGGQTANAKVTSKAAIEPGGVGEIEVEAEMQVVSSPGQRFLLESSGKIVAAGVVTK